MASAATDPFSAFETTGWDRQAAGYHRLLGRITSRAVPPLLAAAAVGAGTRVLDVACGPGYATGRAAARGAVAVGVDVSPVMVDLARGLYPDIEFRVAPAEVLPYEPGSFDAVTAAFLVHHLSRPEDAALEFARVLAPGGRVALTAWDVPERARIVGVLTDAIAEAGAAPPADLPAGPPFFQYSTDENVTGLLRAGGLVDVRVERVSFDFDVSTVDELWQGLMDGTVRSSALVVGQPADVQGRIRAAFDRLAGRYDTGAGLRVPVSVTLASAAKPA